MAVADLDPNLAALISARIDDLRDVVREGFRDNNERLDRIERHVSETNGRVSALEKARERAQGVIFAYSWLPSTLSAVLGAGLTILIIALSGGLH